MRHATRYHPSREYRTEPSEDSDIVVALFRSAVIIAFTLSVVRSPTYTMRSWTWLTVVAAALYTLALMLGYVANRRWLTRRRRQELSSSPFWGYLVARRVVIQRVIAIVIDLLLVSAIITDAGLLGEQLLDIFYVVVAIGAIWFHRQGGVLTALGAVACMIWVMVGSRTGHELADPLFRTEVSARAVILLTVGVVTGYLAWARDAERRGRERMQWEMRMARQVQQALLPGALPQPEGYELGLRFAPASLVGGDYYDALVAPDGRLALVLADVAGKSIYAVLHLSLLRGLLRQAVRDGLAPREIAVRLNAMMLDALPPQSFIGLFYAAVDLSSGTVRYVNCGHTPPVVVRSPEGGATSTLFTGNIVLGVEADPTYDEAEITLGEGDFLVCCTDGVTEAMDEEWRPLDTEGVARAAAAARGGTADEVAEQILAAAREHTARRVTDDATLLVLRRVPRVGG